MANVLLGRHRTFTQLLPLRWLSHGLSVRGSEHSNLIRQLGWHLSLPQLGYGCIELEDSSKKGNMAPEEGEVLAGNGVALTPATSARAG